MLQNTPHWPDRHPLVSDAEPGVLLVGDERIEVGGANRTVLTRYLAAVRRQRGLAPDGPVELRATDLASLSTVLDLDDAALESELAELLDLSPADARWTVRALMVGALMAVGATGVVGSSLLSPAGATTIAATPVAPVAAEVSAPAPADPDTPIYTGVDLAPAVSATAPATEWSYVDDTDDTEDPTG